MGYVNLLYLNAIHVWVKKDPLPSFNGRGSKFVKLL